MKTLIMSISIVCLLSINASAGFFQEEDKQMHMKVSVPFGAVGGLICKKNYQGRGLALSGWKAIACGTIIGMVPGLAKEAVDSRPGGSGWDNRDLAADALGAFIGSVGTVTIWEFNSGDW